MNPNPITDTDDQPDYAETIKLHDEYDGTVSAVCRVTCDAFGNNRVSLRITDPATDRSTWVWMTAADASMLGGALSATSAIAAPDEVEV